MALGGAAQCSGMDPKERPMVGTSFTGDEKGDEKISRLFDHRLYSSRRRPLSFDSLRVWRNLFPTQDFQG